MAEWNPDLYLKYSSERTQPSVDLVARINLGSVHSIIDIGCGPGNSTQILRAKRSSAAIVGLDSSAEMIAKARQDFPEQQWVLADAAILNTEKQYDLVFSNAALQWMPDHETLIPRLFRAVSEGGALAVQVPANRNSPIHQSLLKVAGDPRWRAVVAGCENVLNYQDTDFYYDLLAPLAARIDLWETTYYHVLGGQSDVIDWYKGTGMRPFLDRLPLNLREEFASGVLEGCKADYPVRRGGGVLFPFRRIFFIAYR